MADIWDATKVAVFLRPIKEVSETVKGLIERFKRLKGLVTGDKTEQQQRESRIVEGQLNLARMRLRAQEARRDESKILIEVQGKDGANAEVKSIRGNTNVEVANEALVGVTG
jgi:hypothetical protein